MNFEKYAEAGRRDAFILAKLATPFGEMFGPSGGMDEHETREALLNIRKKGSPPVQSPSRPAALLIRKKIVPPSTPAKALMGLR